MGLDMYLYAEKYVSQNDYSNVNGEYTKTTRPEYMDIKNAAGMGHLPDTEFGGITVKAQIGYWRKANAIHAWFVDNCADGVDECQPIYVGRERLTVLLQVCQQELAVLTKADVVPLVTATASAKSAPFEKAQPVSTSLEPREGFFFGSTDKDEWYIEDLKHTIEIIENALALDGDYEITYQASW